VTPLRREDPLIRRLQVVAAMLARIVGFKSSGRIDEARAELEKAHASLLGSSGELIRRVDERTAARLLGSREAAVAFADLVALEASLEEDAARRGFLEERAARVRAVIAEGANGPDTA
jgi:hypothetical protein